MLIYRYKLAVLEQGFLKSLKEPVQIGNSDVFAEEKEGIDAKALVDHQVAVVGMAAAVNPDAGVKDISKDELKKIFTGKIKNWKEARRQRPKDYTCKPS